MIDERSIVSHEIFASVDWVIIYLDDGRGVKCLVYHNKGSMDSIHVKFCTDVLDFALGSIAQ